MILAVAGSAVGLGNFLRFPGQAAENGGGAFMVAYFISFLIIGLPVCWAEWTLGRHGGQRGYNGAPGVFLAAGKKNWMKYFGVIGVIIPLVIYMYYVYIEAWCLGYAVNFLAGNMEFGSKEESTAWWETFIGFEQDGGALTGFGMQSVGGFLILVFIINFILIYRGLSKGIEWFCKFAMPLLIFIALIVLVRVLTLPPDPENQENNVSTGLGYLWNPQKIILMERSLDADGNPAVDEKGEPQFQESRIIPPKELEDFRAQAEAEPEKYAIKELKLGERLLNPELWLDAAAQIFFSLSVGFGVIITYASYLRRKDDVVLSGLAATSTNEFCEVALGGLITVTAGIVFLGLSGVAGAGTFDLGFKVLPMVFAQMPAGQIFGFLFFFLLFLAAVTSSLSMLQPGIAFLEESLSIDRKASVAILGFVTAVGCGFVVFFSKDVKALDHFDFWVGTLLLFVLATIQIIFFGWVMGIEKGFKEAHQGAAIRIPGFFKIIMKYVCPLFLVTIFILFLLVNVLGVDLSGQGKEQALTYYITDLLGTKDTPANNVAWLSIGLIVLVGALIAILVAHARSYSPEALAEREAAAQAEAEAEDAAAAKI